MSTTSSPEKLTLEERSEILNRAILEYTAKRWRVVSQSPTQAQLARGKNTNHVLHLLLTLITLGVWLVVWIPLMIFGGEERKLLSVNEYGQM
jgi:hypothetical protein